MILRVPDYYEQFKCLAGACKDSCCIGWEIDIDPDTYDYYSSLDGTIGNRLRQHMVDTEDDCHSFELGEKGRCPFLNSENLCDLCIELGEESLSEVCTEYPRFSLWYGQVQQKVLSLSCEEVGRLLFSHEGPVRLLDFVMEEEYEDAWEDAFHEENSDETDSWEEPVDEGEDQLSPERIVFFEQVQSQAIGLLQDRGLPLAQRVRNLLAYLSCAQEVINQAETDSDLQEGKIQKEKPEEAKSAFLWDSNQYEDFCWRMEGYGQLELLDQEWTRAMEGLETLEAEEKYQQALQQFLQSKDYRERDFEQLLVYFISRYFLNAIYDQEAYVYGKLAVCFSLGIRDLAAVRFQQKGSFSQEDMIDVARIFSKEVEHSQENVAFLQEEIIFLG